MMSFRTVTHAALVVSRGREVEEAFSAEVERERENEASFRIRRMCAARAGDVSGGG